MLIRCELTVSKRNRYQRTTHLLFVSVKQILNKLWAFVASTVYSLYYFHTFSLGCSGYTNTPEQPSISAIGP